MRVIPIGEMIAADIKDVDLNQPLDDVSIVAITEAWNENLVLRFRNQRLSDEDLIRFSSYFGELDPPGPNPYGVTFLPEFPEINVISNVKDDTGVPIGNLGDGEAVWHADMTILTTHLRREFSMRLRCQLAKVIPILPIWLLPTTICPLTCGWQLREKLLYTMRLITVLACFAKVMRKSRNKINTGARHPLAYEDQHGRVSLFLGRRPHAYIVGMEESDSDSLLDALWAHATRPKYSWHNEWQKGDLVMWQNRMVMHRRDAFDPSTRRVMHRTQLKGKSPIAVEKYFVLSRLNSIVLLIL